MCKLLALCLAIIVCLPGEAFAHVKWFSEFTFRQPPLDLSAFNHASFWALLALSVVTISGLAWLDRKMEKWGPYARFNDKLESYSGNAVLILRVFTGASLLLAWQADTMIAPDLPVPNQGIGWYQYALALLLLGQVTTPIAGVGMILLYGFSVYSFGLFHLLDYIVYPAVGYALAVSRSKKAAIFNSGIPALYLGLGFSLCWVALEKMFYPRWGLELLREASHLTMGLDPEFFLLACAFVEFSLGYLLIICLLTRPLALTITLIFFTTTALFGKLEVVGHTLLHGALLVFIVVGQGRYFKPPIKFHKSLPLRMAFAGVNFVILLALLGFPYWYLSHKTFEKVVEQGK